MCKAMEDMRNESLQEGMKEGLKEGMKTTALRMLKAEKYTLDEIASISGLSLYEVKKMAEDKNA